MKRPTIHTPRITHDQAACTCRQWPGPSREPGEAIGTYTTRAYEAHAVHAIEIQSAPPDLFSDVPTPPVAPAGSLFEFRD